MEFKDVNGFPGYRIASDGSVWSCYSAGHSRAGTSWSQLRAGRNRTGYLRVSFSVAGRHHRRFVHQLVLEHFVGPRPLGGVACHNDGDRTNNSVENLRWDSVKSNNADRAKHGTLLLGEDHPRSKLSKKDVSKIRGLRRDGLTLTAIAARFRICFGTVSDICRRKTWRHVA